MISGENDPPILSPIYKNQDEYKESHIYKAVNIPFRKVVKEALIDRTVLPPELEECPRDREIVCYCAIGLRSGYLCR